MHRRCEERRAFLPFCLDETLDSGSSPAAQREQELPRAASTASSRMPWAISVGLFLALVFAVLVVMLVWSQRAEIREALREHRKESRIPTDILLELSNVGGTFVETVPAENISRHGARLLTPTLWPPHGRVLIGLPQAVEHSRARIAYCEFLSEHSFAIGLHFSSAFKEWSSDLEWSDHLYRK